MLDEYLEPVSCKSPFTKHLVDGGNWIPTSNGASFLVGQIIVEQSSNLIFDLSIVISLTPKLKAPRPVLATTHQLWEKESPVWGQKSP